MTLVRWDEMRTPVPRNRGPLAPLANQLRRAACQARRANPDLFRSPLLQPTALERRIRGLSGDTWDRICDDLPLPPGAAYDLPFGGGRCETLYRVNAFVDQTNGLTASDFIDNVPGPLSGLRWIEVPTSPTSTSVRFRLVDRNGVERSEGVFSGSPDLISNLRFQIIRIDGLPDDCPVPPEPDPPPITEINNPVDVEINLGGQTFNTPLTFNDYSVGDDNSVTWSPSFNVDGVDFTIQPDGVNIDFGPEFSFAPEVSPQLNIGSIGGAIAQGLTDLAGLIDLLLQILDLLNNLGGGTGECDLTPVIELLNCYLGETNATFGQESVVGSSDGGNFALPDGTVAVIFQLNGVPTTQTRIQSGQSGSPDVVYWGWCSVGRDGVAGERQELHHSPQIFNVPKDFNNVTFTAIRGNVGSITAITKRLNCQPT